MIEDSTSNEGKYYIADDEKDVVVIELDDHGEEYQNVIVKEVIHVDEIKSIGDEVGTITAGTIDINKSFRKKINGYPLDHDVRCSGCSFNGRVGFKQLKCHKCGTILVDPDDAQEDD